MKLSVTVRRTVGTGRPTRTRRQAPVYGPPTDLRSTRAGLEWLTSSVAR